MYERCGHQRPNTTLAGQLLRITHRYKFVAMFFGSHLTRPTFKLLELTPQGSLSLSAPGRQQSLSEQPCLWSTAAVVEGQSDPLLTPHRGTLK